MESVKRDLQSFFYRRLIAKTDGVEPSGLKAAGLAVKAADTGRILMLQRSMADPKDPARGKWEFPGGHIEPGEDARDAAEREWQEETGHKLPAGRHAGSWTSPNGVYRGHLYIVPREEHLPVGALRKQKVMNPDDPDHSEALAWFDPRHLKGNPVVRSEVRRHTDWDVLAAKPQASDHELAQQWNTAAVGPNADRSPLHQGPKGPATPQAPDPATPGERFPEGYITVRPAGKRLHVLVADNPARRTIGLQNTPDLGDYDGLLMRWPAEATASLHNRNVTVPVCASFFDGAGMFRDHFHMLPDDPTAKTAKASHRYALETHADNCDSLGIGPGCSLDMGDDARNGTEQMGDGITNGQLR